MHLPTELWIYLAAAAGSGLGFLAAALLLGARRHRIEKAAWNEARLFYTALFSTPEN